MVRSPSVLPPLAVVILAWALASGCGGGGDGGADGGATATDGPDGAGASADGPSSGADAALPGAKPGAGNTGVPAGVTLTPYAGPCTVTEDGTTLDAVDVTDCVLTIDAADVTVRRSRLRQGVFVRVTTGATIEDSTIDAGVAISSSTGVALRRNDVHGPGDGLHITSDAGVLCDAIVVEANWIHGPEIAAGDHYDVMQVRGVHDLTIRGNTLDAGVWVEVTDGGTNSVLYFEDANGGDDLVVVDGNWLNGGGYMIATSATRASFTDNRVGRDFEFGLLYPEPVPFVESGNTWEDDGSAITFQPPTP